MSSPFDDMEDNNTHNNDDVNFNMEAHEENSNSSSLSSSDDGEKSLEEILNNFDEENNIDSYIKQDDGFSEYSQEDFSSKETSSSSINHNNDDKEDSEFEDTDEYNKDIKDNRNSDSSDDKELKKLLDSDDDKSEENPEGSDDLELENILNSNDDKNDTEQSSSKSNNDSSIPENTIAEGNGISNKLDDSPEKSGESSNSYGTDSNSQLYDETPKNSNDNNYSMLPSDANPVSDEKDAESKTGEKDKNEENKEEDSNKKENNDKNKEENSNKNKEENNDKNKEDENHPKQSEENKSQDKDDKSTDNSNKIDPFSTDKQSSESQSKNDSNSKESGKIDPFNNVEKKVDPFNKENRKDVKEEDLMKSNPSFKDPSNKNNDAAKAAQISKKAKKDSGISKAKNSAALAASVASGNVVGAASSAVKLVNLKKILPVFFVLFTLPMLLLSTCIGGSGGNAAYNAIYEDEKCIPIDDNTNGEDGSADSGIGSINGIAVPATGTFTSGFGSRWGTFHNGIDIAAPIGTNIYAAHDGTVTQAGTATGFGLWVVVQSTDDPSIVTEYGHIDSFNVKAGDKVKAGQHIAEMGNKGFSTGPHLHFTLRMNGEGKDPSAWFRENGIENFPGYDQENAGIQVYAGANNPGVTEGDSVSGIDGGGSTSSPSGRSSGNSSKKGYPKTDVLVSEDHMQADAIRAARAVAREFPEIKQIGGWRPSDPYPDHPEGRAIDVTIPNFNTEEGKKTGDRVKDWLMENKDEFNIEYMIWRQMYIPAEGQPNMMEDKGDPTRNHFDHVHVTVKGGGFHDVPESGGSENNGENTGCKCIGEESGNEDINGSSEPGTNTGDLSKGVDKYAPMIIAAGRYLNLPEDVIIVALGTAEAESNYRVLTNPGVPESSNYPNDGSAVPSNAAGSYGNIIGLFQQTANANWGSVEEIMNPYHAATSFMYRLNKLNNGNLPFGERINSIQIAAVPSQSDYAQILNHFQQKEGIAKSIWNKYKDDPRSQVDSLTSTDKDFINRAKNTSGGGGSSGTDTGSSSQNSNQEKKDDKSVDCGYQGGNGKNDKNTKNINDPNAGSMAIEAASKIREQLNKVVYPGSVPPPPTYGIPVGLDCSGLITWAYREAGYDISTIGRFNTRNLQEWPTVEEKNIAVGDVYLSNIEGNSGHAAMYVGDGKVIESYSTGKPVREISVEEWKQWNNVHSIVRIVDKDNKDLHNQK